jgi:hypothetical protein
MERTADRCAPHFRNDFHTSTANDTRRRPPSLILFSLGLMRYATSLTLVLFFATMLLSSCISFPIVTDAKDQIVHLPWSELAEISRLVEARRDIRKPIVYIWMSGPDYAEVMSGRAQKNRDLLSVFHIRKRAGRWFIEEPKAKDQPVVITG